MAAAVLAMLLTGYAWRRQWLFGHPATPLSPVSESAALDEATLVAVTPGGDAISVHWLSRLRIAVWREHWLVH